MPELSTLVAEGEALGILSGIADGIDVATEAAVALKAPLASPTFTGTVTVPDNTAAGQALQIHAFDAATGRLAYEVDGVVFEVGDTGWVDITADLLNGWTADSVWIRREGNAVSMRFDNLNGTASTAATLLTAVSGFDCGDAVTQRCNFLVNSTGSAARSVHPLALLSNGALVGDQTLPGGHGTGLLGFTDDEWPVSL